MTRLVSRVALFRVYLCAISHSCSRPRAHCSLSPPTLYMPSRSALSWRFWRVFSKQID